MSSRDRFNLIFILLFLIFLIPSNIGVIEHMNSDDVKNPDAYFKNKEIDNGMTPYIHSTDSIDGIMNPIKVEQQGHVVSGNLSDQTDTNPIVSVDLPIDSDNKWMGSRAEVDVWDLQRLYAVNGSFNEGIPGSNLMPTGSVTFYPLGWDANSSRSGTYDDELQLAGYDTSGSQYIVVENQGGKVGQNAFGHTQGTFVAWNQYVENVPYTEDFVFSFDYFYLRGPIDSPDGSWPFPGGNCSLQLLIDGVSVWNMSLLLLSQRGVWLNSGEIPIHISGGSSSFQLEIGLFIDEFMELDKRRDYDGDPLHLPDGLANSAYITVFMDDVSFLKASPPAAEQVKLEFSTGNETAPLFGSAGMYSASIVNQSYWNENSISIQITSNTSVSFSYQARLLCHRFINSSTRSGVQIDGVTYSIELDQSPMMSAYSYLGSLGAYENLSLIFYFPSDWTNISVYNPFSDLVTSNCVVRANELWIPESETSDLGWWQVNFEAPNYVRNVQTQKLTSIGWENSSIFRSPNSTQTSIAIGTLTSTPQNLDEVDVKMKYPNGSVWTEELLNGGIDGRINSSTFVLGAQNTTAGVWSVDVFWENGTEVGFTSANFELHHRSVLSALNPNIEAESGIDEIITCFVSFRDLDNGEFLLDSDAVIQGNWTTSMVAFTPNEVKNRWEGDFDTSGVDGGEYTVQVNVTLPYYDESSCVFSITLIIIDNSLTLYQSSAEIGVYSTYEVSFEYTNESGFNIDNADISVEVRGNPGGLSIGEASQNSSGVYSFNITALLSGTYEITITASKPYYEAAWDILFLTVGEIETNLYFINGTGGQLQIGQSYNLVVRYENLFGEGLDNASVSVFSITPSTGVAYSSVTQIGDGNYSLELQPSSAGAYTLLVRAQLVNHKEKMASFLINVPKLTSSLVILNPTSIIVRNETRVLTFNFSNSIMGGIENASIIPVNPPSSLDFSALDKLGNGLYSILITPNEIGSYQIVFTAFAEDYLDASAAFSFIVNIVDNVLSFNQSSIEMDLYSTYQIEYEFRDQLGNPIDEANSSLEVSENQEGLILTTPVRVGPGIWTFNVTPIQTGRYGITIYAWKEFYEGDQETLFMTVGGIGTELFLENETGQFIQLGTSCNLVIRYINSTGGGLGNASVYVVSTTPSSGIAFSNSTYLGDGYYSFILTPENSGAFIIIIQAEKGNHRTQIASFILNVPLISTTLTLDADNLVAVDQVCIVTFNFTSALLGGIENASITPLELSEELHFSPVEYVSPGIYRIVITPQEIGYYQVVFEASTENHLKSLAAFNLEVTLIPTQASIVGGALDTELVYLEVMEFDLLYTRTDLQHNISEALISISSPDIENFTYHVTDKYGVYSIRIQIKQLGTWKLIIQITKQNHIGGKIEFNLSVGKIETRLDAIITQPSLILNESYIFRLNYTEYTTGIGITSAGISVEGIEEEWYYINQEDMGIYNIVIEGNIIGRYTIKITFQKIGYDKQTNTISFSITKIPVRPDFLENSLTWVQEDPLAISFILKNSLNNETVNGLTISYRLLHLSDRIRSGTFSESPGSGIYSINLNPPWYGDGGYKIIITVESQIYELSSTEQINDISKDIITIIGEKVLPPLSILGVFCIVTGFSYRTYRKREKEKFLRTLAIKKRFDDVDNIIGIIVLHKKSGLSIHSTLVKGGFEEGMISAFITAITQFRGEFDRTDDDWNWEVIPISDIIRIVPTKNLICAFITVSPASMAQEDKMLEFAKAVGMTFDNELEDTPYEVISEEDVVILDRYFEEIMDGFLLHYYKRGTAQDFPRQFRCLEKTIQESGVQECARPILLARYMTDCGLSEADACANILEAINNELIVPCEDPEIHTHEAVDWAVFEE